MKMGDSALNKKKIPVEFRFLGTIQFQLYEKKKQEHKPF